MCQSSIKFLNVINCDAKNKPYAIIPVTFLTAVVLYGLGKRENFVLRCSFPTHPSSFSSNDSAVTERNAKHLPRVNIGSVSLICSPF